MRESQGVIDLWNNISDMVSSGRIHGESNGIEIIEIKIKDKLLLNFQEDTIQQQHFALPTIQH